GRCAADHSCFPSLSHFSPNCLIAAQECPIPRQWGGELDTPKSTVILPPSVKRRGAEDDFVEPAPRLETLDQAKLE
ncbi:MAG: hypothetical protein L0Z50_04425, partial [Verrucomicrobiales bacterium]|nr:hypothetical protein [Verrucomicrobiales bacterium]